LFLLFLIFLVSEGLLFVSFFWTSFHSLSSLTFGISLGEGFYLPDPFELTFANTLLLSNAAICLGNAFISLEFSLEFFTFFSLFSLTCKFSLQIPWILSLTLWSVSAGLISWRDLLPLPFHSHSHNSYNGKYEFKLQDMDIS